MFATRRVTAEIFSTIDVSPRECQYVQLSLVTLSYFAPGDPNVFAGPLRRYSNPSTKLNAFGGFGVITELSTGFPGYDSILGQDNATIGRILKDNGYATSWFGKNHNTPDFQNSEAGPFDQWPSGMGFDYFYGFMGGETDQWTPYLFQFLALWREDQLKRRQDDRFPVAYRSCAKIARPSSKDDKLQSNSR
jgi:hypothetical protein